MSTVQADDFQVIEIRDSISAADTVGAATRADTAYSKWYNLRDAINFQFFRNVFSSEVAAEVDTAWVADTFFVDFQHSMEKDSATALLWLLDTAVTTDGRAWSTLNANTSDSVVGNWGRIRFIHWDSLDAGDDHTGLFGNVYVTKVKVWMNKIDQ